MRAILLLAALLVAAPTAAGDAIELDAHVDPGGTRPPSVPSITWPAADVPPIPFTAIHSGSLARIELPGPQVSYGRPTTAS